MRILLAALIAITLSACSLIPDSGTAEALTVNYLMSKATTRIVDGDADRAAKVVKAVEDARQYIETGEMVTISALYDAAIGRISGLDAADKILIGAILDNARTRLEAAVSTGQLDAQQRVSLLETLDWIEQAASAEL